MKEIKIRQDFGIYELGSEAEITPVIEKIDIENNAEIQLDLTGCLPDYPATSLLIDKIISQMRLMIGEKHLVIILEYSLPLVTLINWLFLGSKELKIEKDKSLSLDEIKSLIQNGIQDSDIEIVIRINDNETNGVKDAIVFK